MELWTVHEPDRARGGGGGGGGSPPRVSVCCANVLPALPPSAGSRYRLLPMSVLDSEIEGSGRFGCCRQAKGFPLNQVEAAVIAVGTYTPGCRPLVRLIIAALVAVVCARL